MKSMKITYQTSTQLVLKQMNLANRVYGLVFAGIGVFAILIASQNKGFAFLIGGIFALLGIFVFLFNKSVIVSIDKARESVIVGFRSLVGAEDKNLFFNEIKEIAVESYVQNYSHSAPLRDVSHNLVFYTENGDSILIHMDSPASGLVLLGYRVATNYRNNSVEIGRTIAEFIGKPFIERKPPTISELIQQTRDAVTPKGTQEPHI